MKTILVPTDFSKNSEKAIERAATIAKNHNASLLIVHMAGISESPLIKTESQSAEESIFHLKLAEKTLKNYFKNLF